MESAEERATVSNLHALNTQDSGWNLSEADLLAMEQDGAILLRNFFSPTDYHPLYQDLSDRIALLEQHSNLPPQGSSLDIGTLSDRILRLEQQDPENQSILYDAISAAPSLHGLASHPQLNHVVHQILSPIINLHPRLILLMSLPQNEWHLATWHQDWYYNKGPYSTLTLYAPLQETSSQNGSLKLALGEHHRGPIEHGEFTHGFQTKWKGLPTDTVADFKRVVSTHLKVGDILLFNSLVPHSAQINQSNAIRFVINLRFQDLSNPDYLAAGWRINENHDAREALRQKPPSR